MLSSLSRAMFEISCFMLAIFSVLGCEADTPSTGTIVINVSPDSIDAPWMVDGSSGELYSGIGDQTLSNCPNGSYTVTWCAVLGCVAPSSESKMLGPDQTITFTGLYLGQPAGTGSIIVDAEPDYLNASWDFTGPGDFSYIGQGDTIFTAMEPGDYTMTWQDETNFIEPVPNPDTKALMGDDTLLFEGVYSQEFVVGIPEMIEVPHGSFVMGDGASFCGFVERDVTLTRNFHLGRYEVTNKQFVDALQWAYENGYVTVTAAAVLDNLDGSTVELVNLDDDDCEIDYSSGFFSVRDIGHGLCPDHPVKEITWFGAARYCDWLSMYEGRERAYAHDGDWACNAGDPYGAEGYRLPTDAEWEYAAQYDDERIFPWGNQLPDCIRANYGDCNNWTTPVGSCSEGVSALGLYDMAGNLLEWCNDWAQCELGIETITDPAGPVTGDYRVLHGGSWFYADLAPELRCAARPRTWPTDSYEYYGFRIARTAAR